MKHRSYRYEKILERLIGAVEMDIYRHGDRLPSVRQLMATEGASQSTAVRVLVELEARGLAYSRERSGFFVRRPAGSKKRSLEPAMLDIPRPTESSQGPHPVDVHHLIQDLFKAFRTSDLLAFGAAEVAKNLLPTAELTEAMKRAVRVHGPSIYKTSDPHGVPELRRAVAAFLQRRGLLVSETDVLITAGETDAMAIALRALTRPGDAVAVESPTFFGILQEIQEAGLHVIEIATHPTTGIDVDELIRAADDNKVQAVVLNPTFENPFGCCMEPYALRAITDAMNQRSIPVIEDDVYSDLNFRNKPVKALASFDFYGNTVYCGSFSKILSPGLRVGWCVPGKHADVVKDIQLRRPTAVSTLSQYTLVEYLNGRRYAKHCSRLSDLFLRQRDQVRKLIKDTFPIGSTATNPEGGFLFWIEIPPPFDAMEFYRRALKLGISIAPGPIFSVSNRFDHCFRLSVGAKLTPEIRNAIRKLGKLAEEIVREMATSPCRDAKG
ncbi:PLP-dependent aminotransferase family protein [Rhodopseudomonas sp. HC1]|uniref:aminotransferase-like domain-containing protein n=1 Tax=Rhodopseudomonas infernalis TaxID=2897386 RepID=UPI0029E81FE9|nr:PLP-dependent aminotransferase family protein [Rhodopseudomonas infernalis]MCG6204125.1 PLP-dependent aminotransferase family protein [Rhodopseudomonas infernalis]